MNPKTGKQINCSNCGTEFYVAGWQVRQKDEKRRPKFCSRKCKAEAWSVRKMPWATPDKKTFHTAGYVLVWAPNHPRATRRTKRVFEHILVAEKLLGRYLDRDEQVHHKDHDKKNNDPINLIVLTSSEHAKLHSESSLQTQSRKVELKCEECGATFKVSPSRAHSGDAKLKRKYCSLPCRHKSWGRQMKTLRKKET